MRSHCKVSAALTCASGLQLHGTGRLQAALCVRPQIVDRSKDVIKSGGEWISSIEVENAAAAHPKVP
jgi:acyl-CoA synthetase (AMP-forming)/AMP-acid ligase II